MKIRNFTPTITNLSKKILKIGNQQLKYFRTTQFGNLALECKNLLKDILNLDNHSIVFLTASGTGAMDAVITNFINKKHKILIINRGVFGQRWCDICNTYKINYEETNSLEIETIIKNKKINLILTQATETSTTEKLPIEKIKKLCKKYKIKLIVDAISGLFVDILNVKDIDVCLLSSQKGLSLFPGISLIITNNKIPINPQNYYFNLNKYINKKDSDMIFPFTPNTIVLNQLLNKLKYIKKIGLNNYIKKYNKQAIHFREIIKNLPLEIVTENMSNCGTLLKASSKKGEIKKFFEYLQTKNIFISPVGGEIGDTFIIGHIGNLTKRDNLILYKELKKWLK
jgi:aspartate aminotransferase-like enzyme